MLNVTLRCLSDLRIKALTAEYWSCDRGCGKTVRVEDILDAFYDTELELENELEIKILAFAIDDREIRIEVLSDKYTNESRTHSKKILLSKTECDAIERILLRGICEILGVECMSLADLFQS